MNLMFNSITSMPIIVKGVLRPDDAELAIHHGVAGIAVSNHGGRQLDGVPATIDALPAIIKQVANRCEVFVDGGITRGTDILKALALGAKMVEWSTHCQSIAVFFNYWNRRLLGVRRYGD